MFEGHPFIVEAGLSLGGKDVKQVSFLCDLYSLQNTQKQSFSSLVYFSMPSLFHMHSEAGDWHATVTNLSENLLVHY